MAIAFFSWFENFSSLPHLSFSLSLFARLLRLPQSLESTKVVENCCNYFSFSIALITPDKYASIIVASIGVVERIYNHLNYNYWVTFIYRSLCFGLHVVTSLVFVATNTSVPVVNHNLVEKTRHFNTN